MRRPVRSLLVLIVLASILAPAAGASASPRLAPGRCVDAPIRANRLALKVGGERATGRYALPRKPPRTLLVYAHGYGHSTVSWVKHFENADRHGVAAVGMDYRGLKVRPDANGDGYPEASGFNVWKGSEDLIAAAKWFRKACPSIRRVVMFSVSLGGNVAGIALARSAEMGSTPENPLFDEWIDVEGEVNLVESTIEARLVAPANEFATRVVKDIEEECGGPIEEVPQAYLDRTVVARVGDIAASGLRAAVVIHSLDDGLVPYNQAREIATLMTATGIDTDLVTIGRRSRQSERETTLTSYAAGQLDPDYTSPLSGHASEKSTTHIVMVTAFERLWSLLGGEDAGPYREFFVDGEAGRFPQS